MDKAQILCEWGNFSMILFGRFAVSSFIIFLTDIFFSMQHIFLHVKIVRVASYGSNLSS